MRNIAVLGLFILCLSACGNPASEEPSEEALLARAEKEREAALQEIEAANRLITELTAKGEIEQASAYFAEDVVQLISGQPPVNSREEWIAAQRAMAAIGEWDLELEVLDFEYLGDRAVERGHGVQTFQANADSPIPSMRTEGDYLVLWVKTDTGWQIKWDYVVLQPPQPTEAE